MANLRVQKEVAALPDPLVANTIYLVRVGAGFDMHVTDSTGAIAYSLNTNNTEMLAQIEALEPDEKDFLQFVDGEWKNRTAAQVTADLKNEIKRISRRQAMIFGG